LEILQISQEGDRKISKALGYNLPGQEERLCQTRRIGEESLGTFESAIMGIAGTAPAFSVAVTTATIVAS
jgi:hypothetical protein